jgi:hypothetical protein
VTHLSRQDGLTVARGLQPDCVNASDQHAQIVCDDLAEHSVHLPISDRRRTHPKSRPVPSVAQPPPPSTSGHRPNRLVSACAVTDPAPRASSYSLIVGARPNRVASRRIKGQLLVPWLSKPVDTPAAS